jgi:large subunit ribosomal protein L22
MKFIATQKNTRQTPRKVRLVANQVKGLPLEQALKQLAVIERKSTLMLLKVVKQAIANAKNNHGVAADQLEIESIIVNEASRLRRFRAVSRGRAHGVIKRNSHITVTLREKAAPAAAETKTAAAATAAPVKTEDKKEVAPKAAAPKKAAAKKETAKSTSSKKSK